MWLDVNSSIDPVSPPLWFGKHPSSSISPHSSGLRQCLVSEGPPTSDKWKVTGLTSQIQIRHTQNFSVSLPLSYTQFYPFNLFEHKKTVVIINMLNSLFLYRAYTS